MQIGAVKACRGLRWGVIGFATVFAVTAVTSDPADARAKRKRAAPHKTTVAAAYSPPYSDIVVDANSGAVLHSSAPDSPRHPASLTKIMTLYLLFEQLEAGKMTFKTEMPVSAHAAAQAPSKLGLKPGQTIQVEDAIKATVTRSANDVAVVIAEALGGDEPTFGKMMTAKARSLGMQNTVYKNASGLPDDAQITTARDQATLGRAIQERFPKYYGYFSTTRFYYRGNTIGNHNRLLGKVEGVDGIKTGYTNASGFNLVTSLRRNGRHIVAVVLGGRSASSRDEKMRALVNDYVRVASTKQTAPKIAEAPTAAPRTAVQRIAAAVITPARADPAPTASIPMPRPAPLAAATAPGSSDPLEPITVKTFTVKPGSAQAVSLAPAHPGPSKGPELAFADPTAHMPQPGILGVLPVKNASTLPSAAAAPETVEQVLRPAQRSGWMIQVGAFDREDEAKMRLSTAQTRAKALLASADGFTERVTKGDKTLYRARFAGLEKQQAEAACQFLKKNEIACMALKN